MDLSMTFRLSGLANFQKLTVRSKIGLRSSGNNISSNSTSTSESNGNANNNSDNQNGHSASAPASVLIGIQLTNGERLQNHFPTSTTLWEVVQWCVSKGKLSEQQSAHVGLNYLLTQVNGADELRAKSLRDIGLLSGNGLLRLSMQKDLDGSSSEIGELKKRKRNINVKIVLIVSFFFLYRSSNDEP
jgi:hypothetical protein